MFSTATSRTISALVLLSSLAASALSGRAAAQTPNATFFFADYTAATPVALGSASFSGLDPFDVLVDSTSNSPAIWGMAPDRVNGHLYYCDGGGVGSIDRVHFNGTERVTLLPGSAGNIIPRGVTLDPIGQRLYFISPGTANRIGSCALDGSDVQILLQYNDMVPAVAPRSIHVDGVAGKMYWWNVGHGFRRANLDGSQPEDVLLIAASVSSWEVDLVNGWMYWVQNADICKAPIDGSSAPQIVLSDPDFPDQDCLAVLPEADVLAWVGAGPALRWTSLASPGVVHESAQVQGTSAFRTIDLMAGPRVIVTASQTTLQVGDTVTLGACGGQHGTPVLLFVRAPNSFAFRLAFGMLDSVGSFQSQWKVPQGFAPGTYELLALAVDPAGVHVTTLPLELQVQ